MRKTLVPALVLAVVATLGAGAMAQEKAPAAPKKPVAKKPMHAVTNEADVKWGNAPPSLPPGAKMAVLQGDPGKPGMFTIRVKSPDGYKVAPHWHPTAESVTVLSGTFYLGTGDTLDEKKATAMTAGAFSYMPAKMHHFASTKGETEFQVSGMGPFEITYLNPADDPRNAKK